MRRLPTWTLIVLVLACLLAASGRATQSAALREARGRAELAARKPTGVLAVGLRSLSTDPSTWLGAQVRFEGQVHSLPEAWSGLLTRFGPGEFVALRLWADEQLLWEPDAFRTPAASVYVRRDSPAAAALADARVYQRFVLTGSVEQVLAGRPWIEVTEALRLPEEMTEGAIPHATRGIQLREAGDWTLAAEELQRALASVPPPRASAELTRLRADCLAQLEARAAKSR
jgi:hypothetical protein